MLRKLHRWAGLLAAAFVLFYGITGILLNHRALFGYFIKKEITVYPIPVSDADGMRTFMNSFKAHIEREDDPTVIKIKGEVVEFLYGSHGKTTYSINPEKGIMTVTQKLNKEPLSGMNRLHKAFKTSLAWVIISDLFSILLILVTLTGMILLKYRMIDYIFVFSGTLLLVIGAATGL